MAKPKTKKQSLTELHPRMFLHQPHDKYVRFVLHIREMAVAFLRYALNEPLKALIDWESLEISNDTYIDEYLQAYYTDVCYTGITKLGTDFRIATLIEHKSDVPVRGHLTHQLGRYILNAWQDDLKNKRSLTLTIPIVLYHGKKTLEKENSAILFPEAPEWLRTFVPSFDYVLIDLSTRTDQELDGIQTMFLGKFLTALKHVRNEAFFAISWKKFVIFASEESNDVVYSKPFVTATILYLSAASKTFNKNFQAMDDLLTTNEKKEVLPYVIELFEKAYVDGMEKGIKDGLEKGMEKGIKRGMQKGIKEGIKEGKEMGVKEGMEKSIQTFMIKHPEWTDTQIAESFDVETTFVQAIRTKSNV